MANLLFIIIPLQGILNWNLRAKPWFYNSTVFDAYQQEGNRFGSIRDFLEPLKSQIRSVVESADSLLMDVQAILTAEILHSSLEVMLLLEIGGYMNLWKLLYKYWHHSYFDPSNPKLPANGRGTWGFNVTGQSESFFSLISKDQWFFKCVGNGDRKQEMLLSSDMVVFHLSLTFQVLPIPSTAFGMKCFYE